MREVTYKLKEKLDGEVDNPYSGEVVLKLLPYVQRNELLRKVNFKIDQSKADLADNLDANARLAEVVKDNVVSLEVKKGNHVFKSLDELDYDCDAGHFYTEIGVVLCKGLDMGNV